MVDSSLEVWRMIAVVEADSSLVVEPVINNELIYLKLTWGLAYDCCWY